MAISTVENHPAFRDQFVQLLVDCKGVEEFAVGEVGAVGDAGGGDGDDLVKLFVLSGFGHAGEGVFADVIHFGSGDGDDEVGLSDLGGGTGGKVSDVGASEEGFERVRDH